MASDAQSNVRLSLWRPPFQRKSPLHPLPRKPLQEDLRPASPTVPCSGGILAPARPLWARGSQALTFLGRRGPPCPALAHQEPGEEGPLTASWPPPVSYGSFHHGAKAPSLLRGLLLRRHKVALRGLRHSQQRHCPHPTLRPPCVLRAPGRAQAPSRARTYRIGAEGLPLGTQEVGEIAVLAELHDHHEGA